jgi:hypothetical protein
MRRLVGSNPTPAASAPAASTGEAREGERLFEAPHSLDGAHRRRGERADGVCETRRPLERPARQSAVEDPGDEGISRSRAVDLIHLNRLESTLEALPRRVAARGAALEHD